MSSTTCRPGTTPMTHHPIGETMPLLALTAAGHGRIVAGPALVGVGLTLSGGFRALSAIGLVPFAAGLVDLGIPASRAPKQSPGGALRETAGRR